MIITYFGNQFFKVAQGDTVVAINPPSKDSKSGKGASRFGSNLLLITTNHPDFNGVETATYGDNVPFVIDGPGEYEHSGIAVGGTGTMTHIDDKEYNTTAYSMLLEDIKIGFLGPIEKPLVDTELDVLSGTDILFVPVDRIGPAQAYKLAVAIGPKIMIPMSYTKDSLKTFLKEAGEDTVEALDKLTIRKKEIESKDGEVIVLSEN